MSKAALLIAAIGLAMVIEGLFPLLAPRLWRRVVVQIAAFKPGQIRFFGAAVAAAGLGLLLLVWK
jgi:uncharacterized protein YjeT (DUF2065 family)